MNDTHLTPNPNVPKPDFPDLLHPAFPDEDGAQEEAPSPLAGVDLAHYFGPDGPLARLLEGYEMRPSQLQMAEAVRRAILERTTALIEAPTGTGKSLAYLLPALLSGKTVVVATANKSLQNQLYTKEIPFLSRVLGRPIDAVVVKGRSNYVCTYKWEKEHQQQLWLAQLDERLAQGEALEAVAGDLEPLAGHRQAIHLHGWLQETVTGDVDDLPFELESDLRRRTVSFSDDCLHQDCPHYHDACWVNFMRDRAGEAQVIITNHHLLLTALQLAEAGERLLPPAPIVIVDEAHQLESTATAVFETEVTNYSLEQLLNRALFQEHLGEEVVDELKEWNFLAFEEIANLSDEATFPIQGELAGLSRLSARLARVLDRLIQANPYREEQGGETGRRGQDEEGNEERALYELAVENLASLIDKLRILATERHDGQVVRYAERVLGQRHVRLRLHAAPLNPGDLLAEHLFQTEQRTVICTSATLATDGHFQHFKQRCGVPEPTIELVAPPVFDYPNQALLYQPSLPAYDWRNKEAYYDQVAEEIRRLLEVSRGRALCLFTNWSGLRQVRERLGEEAGIWPLRAQGEGSRNALLEWFRETPHSVLLATRSFWEGVDLPGDGLSLVVLDKLPFPSPSDPLHSARMQALDQAEGRNSFGDYMLPLMTLTLKQGFGRLIRRASDRGVVAVLDERLSSKAYGRRSRSNLPPARFTRRFPDVHRFFREALGSRADFALNVQAEAEAGGELRWSWRLLRLQDGKADQASGRIPGEEPVLGEIHGAIQGLMDLRRRITQAGRQPNSFGVELRCSPAARQLLDGGAMPDELRRQWVQECSIWGGLDVLGIG